MERKIYFAGSISGGTQDSELYIRLINILKKYGEVMTEIIWSKNLKKTDGKGPRPDKVVHDQDVGWLSEASYLVAEVTQPSLGVGYELGRAVAMGKKILCLYRPRPDRSLSAMVAGAHNGSSFIVKQYTEAEADGIFNEFFNEKSLN